MQPGWSTTTDGPPERPLQQHTQTPRRGRLWSWGQGAPCTRPARAAAPGRPPGPEAAVGATSECSRDRRGRHRPSSWDCPKADPCSSAPATSHAPSTVALSPHFLELIAQRKDGGTHARYVIFGLECVALLLLVCLPDGLPITLKSAMALLQQSVLNTLVGFLFAIPVNSVQCAPDFGAPPQEIPFWHVHQATSRGEAKEPQGEPWHVGSLIQLLQSSMWVFQLGVSISPVWRNLKVFRETSRCLEKSQGA